MQESLDLPRDPLLSFSPIHHMGHQVALCDWREQDKSNAFAQNTGAGRYENISAAANHMPLMRIDSQR